MASIMLSYTLFWVCLGYRIRHGIAHRLLRIIPMPPRLRHHIAGGVALIPYLWGCGISRWPSTSAGGPM